MSYILSNLKDNEKLAFKSSQSIKSLFFWSFIFGFIGLALVLLKGFVIIMGVSLYLIYNYLFYNWVWNYKYKGYI